MCEEEVCVSVCVCISMSPRVYISASKCVRDARTFTCRFAEPWAETGDGIGEQLYGCLCVLCDLIPILPWRTLSSSPPLFFFSVSGCTSVGCWVSRGGETGTVWLASEGPEGPCGIVETQLAEASGARERGLLALNRSRVYRVRPYAPPRDHVHALHLLKRWAIRGPCPNSKPEYSQCGCRCIIHVAL